MQKVRLVDVKYFLSKSKMISLVIALCSSCLVVTSIIMLIVFFGYRSDTGVTRTKILSAINSNSSLFPADWSKNIITGVDTFSDCLTLEIATHIPDDYPSALSSALYEAGSEFHSCVGVIGRLNRFQSTSVISDYWRYWWGSASLLKIVLNVDDITLSGYQVTLKYGTYIALVLISALSLLIFKSNGLLVTPITFAMAFGYGIPIFGQSIAHAPGLLVGLVLIILYIGLHPLRIREYYRSAFAFTIGGLAFYFDLLNGNLIALLILFCIVNLASLRSERSNLSWSITTSTLMILLSYVAGATYVLLLRCIFRALLMGQGVDTVIPEWFDALAIRTRNSVPDYDSFNFGPTYILKRIYYKLEYAFVPYLDHTGAVVAYFIGIALFLICIGWIIMSLIRGLYLHKDAICSLLVISVIVPAWFFTFANHTAVHSWMTGRLSTLFLACGMTLAVLLASAASTRGEPSRAATQ